MRICIFNDVTDLKCQFSTKCKCMLTHNKKIQFFKLLVGNKFKTVIVLKRRRKNLAQYFNPPKLNIYVQNICTGHSCYVNERSTCSVSGSGIFFFTKGSYTVHTYCTMFTMLGCLNSTQIPRKWVKSAECRTNVSKEKPLSRRELSCYCLNI